MHIYTARCADFCRPLCDFLGIVLVNGGVPCGACGEEVWWSAAVKSCFDLFVGQTEGVVLFRGHSS